MDANTTYPRLPPELLQLIVENVLPSNPHILLPARHPSTRTLLTLTRVSRATYALATRLLRQRCIYLDKSRRLGDLLLCMDRFVPTLQPATPALRSITSLYLSPFSQSLDDQPTAAWVRELLCEVAPTLRRLVVHMPFGTLDPHSDHLNVRRSLREGFAAVTHLEEFVCVGEYPALSLREDEVQTDVWRMWPNLSRLALFGVPLDNHWLWWNFATLENLTHVVLARPLNWASVNIKDEYFHKLPRDDPRLDRQIRLVLLGAAYEILQVPHDRWSDIDPHGRMIVEQYDVPTAFYGDETIEQLVTAWVKRGALDGSLWEWEGAHIGDSPKPVDAVTVTTSSQS